MDHMISKWKWKWSLIKRASQTFSLSPHDNELRDLTSLRRPALSLSLSLSVLRQALFSHMRPVPEGFVPLFPSHPSLSVSATHRQGWRKKERWDWGRGVPLSLALAQTLIYRMLTDVILIQSFIPFFSFSFWFRPISPGKA